jgi:hypothetical protein
MTESGPERRRPIPEGSIDALRKTVRGQGERLVIAAAAVAMLLGVLAASVAQQRALPAHERAARQDALDVAASLVGRVVDRGHLTPPRRDRYGAVAAAVREDLSAHAGIVRARVWDVRRGLVFSSEERDRGGTRIGERADEITAAAAGRTVASFAVEAVSRGGRTPARPTRLLRTFTPLATRGEGRPLGVAEIDHRYADIVAAARGPWAALRATFGLGMVAMLLVLAISVRSRAPLGHGQEALEGSSVGENGGDRLAPGASAGAARRADGRPHRPDDATARRELSELRALVSKSEQRADLAELRVGDAERRARAAEDRARIADERARTAEQRLRAFEDEASTPERDDPTAQARRSTA